MIYPTPHQRTNVAQGRFKVGPVAEPKPNSTGSSKNASDPVGIPLFGALQAPGNKPNPSEEG